jgi:hypothetical protein
LLSNNFFDNSLVIKGFKRFETWQVRVESLFIRVKSAGKFFLIFLIFFFNFLISFYSRP